MPAQKAEPAPRRTTTRTSARPSSASKQSRRAESSAAFIALRLSGRLSVMVATPSATVERTSSAMQRRWYHPRAWRSSPVSRSRRSCAPCAPRCVASSRTRSSRSSSGSIRTRPSSPPRTGSASPPRRRPRGVVFARTDTTKGRDGISCFIVERGTPGFSARNIRTIRTSAVPNDVVFEDCELPAENLVGAPGQGLDLAFDLLVKNRFPYSACNLGVAVAAHRMAVAHAKQRSTFGAPLAQRQAIQWMLADAEVEIRAARWLIWEGAWKADRGEDARVEASIAKLYSSEVLGRVIDAAVQIHGGYGVSKEFPVERWYREARVRRIGEGPSEVHRMVIARSLFR